MKTLFKDLFKVILIVLTLLLTQPLQSKEKKVDFGEPIQIPAMSWQSGGVLAHVVDRIISKGLERPTKIVSGDTVPTTSSMLSRGKPHIAPELWIGSITEIWEKAIQKKKIYSAGEIFKEGPQEGWWIPNYVAKKYPKLKSVEDLKDYAHLFTEPSSRGLGRFYTCPPGWSCEVVNANLFKALKMEEKYELFSPGSGGALDAVIARRVKQKKPILTYYWAPTALIGKYKLVKLKMAKHNPQKWTCLTKTNCKKPQYTGWIKGRVVVAAVERIKKLKDVNSFLKKLSLPNKVVNKTLAWMENNSASNVDTATYFFKKYPNIWKKWISKEAAQRVIASL